MAIGSLPFIPGLTLCEIFYLEAVRPVLDHNFPHLIHSAARLDYGSDVLGFDTPLSRDHGWGPKVTLYLSPDDHNQFKNEISGVMADQLPSEIQGYPTNFDTPFSGEGSMVPVESGPVNHWVWVTTVKDFFNRYLGFDTEGSIDIIDWLTTPQTNLRTIASGKVFHDGLDQLNGVREKLRWYPQDIWLYLLANQWRRIDQEEPFMARCGDVGDEVGSNIAAARQIIEIMRLCFLMERQFFPYFKWFGTAFNSLACADELNPIFQDVFDSQSWGGREENLSKAYLTVMQMHNELGLTPTIDPEITYFHNRPYQVPHSSRFVDALHAAIQDEQVRDLPMNVGGVSQAVDSTDILSSPHLSRNFRAFFK